jgi:hypothetical protein
MLILEGDAGSDKNAGLRMPVLEGLPVLNIAEAAVVVASPISDESHIWLTRTLATLLWLGMVLYTHQTM